MGQIRKIMVIGAGTMGHGIAHVAAAGGFEVDLHDVDRRAIDRGLAGIRGNLDKGVERGKVTEAGRSEVLSRVHAAESFDQAASSADLIVEAVPESVELKRRILTQADGAAPAHAILASNTSSLPIAQLAAATDRPDKVIGMHFFNPVHLMALLELVRAEATSEETVAAAVAVAGQMGKEPIVVRDSPGFATSRLGLVLGLEAIRMVEQGVASAEDIDKAMSLGYRHPMGPLRLTDLVGLDVRLAIAEHLHRELASDAFEPPVLLRSMVAAGKLGKKSGQGFYEWS